MIINIYGTKCKVPDGIKPYGMFSNFGDRALKGTIARAIAEIQRKTGNNPKVSAGTYEAVGDNGAKISFEVLG